MSSGLPHKLRRAAAIVAARYSPATPAYLRKIMSVTGQLSVDECKLLYALASEVSAGSVVEIGSYRGKSTTALALGSRDHAGIPVYAIEPHEEFEGVLGGSFGPQDRVAFFKHMLRCGVCETIRLVNLPSEVAACGWAAPVSLLWIDGDHRYEGVKKDFEC